MARAPSARAGESSALRMTDRNLCCSWSGGKDSCLALYRALSSGRQLTCVVTMFTEDGERSRSHGLPREVVEAQAASLQVPLISASASWENYEAAFIALLGKAKAIGAQTVVFGDIDIPRHREWEESVRRAAELNSELPLWQHDRMALLEEF